jgi:hypothetical protein
MAEVDPGALTSRGTGDPSPSSPSGKPPMSQGKKLAVGAAVLGGLFLVYMFAKSRSGSSSTTGTSSTTPTLVLPSSTQDSTGSANYAALASQLNTLSNQLSQNQTNAQSNLTGESLVGLGYQPGAAGTTPSAGSTVQSNTGQSFSWITYPQEQALQAGGIPLFYQPTPGNFQQVPANTPLPNTAIYTQS